MGIRRRAGRGIGSYSLRAVNAARRVVSSPAARAHFDELQQSWSLGRSKLPDDRTIASLQDILVVSSTEPQMEYYRREPDGWKIHDLRGRGTLRLEAFDVTLDLAELYARVHARSGERYSTTPLRL